MSFVRRGNPRVYPEATEEDISCPGCGALSLATFDEIGIDQTYFICTNENCEWTGQITELPHETAQYFRNLWQGQRTEVER